MAKIFDLDKLTLDDVERFYRLDVGDMFAFANRTTLYKVIYRSEGDRDDPETYNKITVTYTDLVKNEQYSKTVKRGDFYPLVVIPNKSWF